MQTVRVRGDPLHHERGLERQVEVGVVEVELEEVVMVELLRVKLGLEQEGRKMVLTSDVCCAAGVRLLFSTDYSVS